MTIERGPSISPEEANSGKDTLKKVIEEQNLGGIAAELEIIYNQPDRLTALRSVEFLHARELVDDFRDYVTHKDGTALDIPEAIQILRIIAKEQEWNEDYVNWDILRSEAKKMGYTVVVAKKVGVGFD
jgi:hypothetical protein